MARSSDPTPVRITSAPVSRSDEIAARQRRYLISMTIRTLCVVLAAIFHESWALWVFLAGAVFLPYVAVVQANTTDQRDTSVDLVGPDPQRKMLDP